MPNARRGVALPVSLPRPLRVAVAGSGPAGFYAAEALLRNTEVPVEVDVFDRLPTPYGLVRGGVAPDHPKIKSVTRVLERTAERPAFRFLGNVKVGRDLTVEELRSHYHQIVYATGNETDRRLGIPGEGIPGSTPATVFIGWYNGHPDYRPARIRLDAERAAIIGNGNVAIDSARILLRTPGELATTDMPEYAREALAASRVREVWLLGRRSPAQAAFTPQELGELVDLADTDLLVEPSDLELDAVGEAEVAASPQSRKNLDLLRNVAARGRTGKGRVVHLRFCVSPSAFVADASGSLCALTLERNRLESLPDGSVAARPTGETETLEVGLALSAIGYAADPIPGVPFDDRARLVRRGVAVVGFSDWKRLDEVEVARGALRGAPRDKIADVQAMLDLLGDGA